ncbi:MAG: glycosyltransferase [Desulfobacterales bacterium]|nr:glycosyltransferase [Desulfobacterales bacterium]
MNCKRGILLYDQLACMGGAERLTLILLQELKHAELCVGYVESPDILTPYLSAIKIHQISYKSSIPGWHMLHLYEDFKRKSGFIKNFDWVIFSGAAAPIAVHHHLSGNNYLYCHTIPRVAYDLKDFYLNKLSLWNRQILKALIAYIRFHYEKAIDQMDIIAVNSKNTQQRLKQFTGHDSIIIYPPCEIDRFQWINQNDYYLSTARLEEFKRVDIIVKAFMRMPDKNLIVASGGQQLETLRSMAKPYKNIHFTGWIPDQTLIELIGKAIATIYIPIDEDFGMSPIESMAAGKPVIGVAEGGLLESIVHGETGLLINSPPSEDDIINAVRTLTPNFAKTMRTACENRAKQFSKDMFIQKIKSAFHIGN